MWYKLYWEGKLNYLAKIVGNKVHVYYILDRNNKWKNIDWDQRKDPDWPEWIAPRTDGVWTRKKVSKEEMFVLML